MHWKIIIEITLLWFAIYQMLLFFERSRAIYVFRGIFVLIVAFLLFKKMDFQVLSLILEKIFTISIITLLIIFHPEIRQGLARLGQRHFFAPSIKEQDPDTILAEISKALDNLCKQKIGALIAIEKNESLNDYIESGVYIDAVISSELIESVFAPNSILHDGGMIIQNTRVSAAGCIFPLTKKHDLNRIFGTRHRAALGLSEETDAIIIVISEERQDVSIVYKSKLYKDLGREEILSRIKEMISKKA